MWEYHSIRTLRPGVHDHFATLKPEATKADHVVARVNTIERCDQGCHHRRLPVLRDDTIDAKCHEPIESTYCLKRLHALAWVKNGVGLRIHTNQRRRASLQFSLHCETNALHQYTHRGDSSDALHRISWTSERPTLASLP